MDDTGRLDLTLFGCWRLRVSGQPVELGHREQRLIALLALRGRRARPHVAGTLWPDTTEERALTSLRAAVLRSRRAVTGLLDAGRSTVALGPQVNVDVHALLRCASEIGHGWQAGASETLTLLSRGDLLPGWYEDWVLFEKEQLQHLRLRALEFLALSELGRGNHDLALSAAQQAITIEPLRESAQSIVIRAHLLAGNPSAAIHAYRVYRRRLQDELSIVPVLEIDDLLSPLLLSRQRQPRRPRNAFALAEPEDG